MKQVVVRKPGGPEVMEIVEIPDPVPGPGEVLLRNDSIGVTGPHILIRENRYRFPPEYPTGLGTDSTGRIAAIGPGVTEFRVGDPAYFSWRLMPDNVYIYADKILAPAQAVQLLPDDIDLEMAAGIGNYSSAYAMLTEAPRNHLFKSVLVVGSSGSLGNCLVELAHQMGKTVIGLVSSEEKGKLVRAKGADFTINYKTENIVERVKALTGGRGVDLIVDHLGGADFTDYFDMLTKWGTIVSINGVNGSPRKDTFEEGRNHAMSCVSIIFFAMHVYEMDYTSQKGFVSAIVSMMQAGKLDSPVAARFALNDVRKSHELLESGTVFGRILLKP